jgi:3-isopropylmalate dehydrogenase
MSEGEMSINDEFKIAVLPGDGIGIEVMGVCLDVLAHVQAKIGGFSLANEILPCGAGHYLDTGTDLPDETFKKAEEADAVLLGAMGLPDVRRADGTEINPQLDFRIEFELFAGVRPVKVLPGIPAALTESRAADIDMVVIREQTEGLFIDIRAEKSENNLEVANRCLITRPGTERVTDFAFDLARRRKAEGGKGTVTCVDKANVLSSMAFFRKIFDERAALNSDITGEHAYIDIMAHNLVRRPWDYDVMVMENLFGDIVSDLTAALIGGMGVAPSADLGLKHGVFQPCHGTAPDIAGQGIANPTAMLLSAALMLDWLGDKHDHEKCKMAGKVLEEAVQQGYALGTIKSAEFGGSDGTVAISETIKKLI